MLSQKVKCNISEKDIDDYRITNIQISKKIQLILKYDQQFNCFVYYRKGSQSVLINLQRQQLQEIQSCVKYYSQTFQQSTKNLINQIKLILQNSNFKLLGGGCGASKQPLNSVFKCDDQLEQQVLDQGFIESYNKMTNKKEIILNIEGDKQTQSAKILFEQSIYKFKQVILTNINLYKPYVLELFETYLIYYITSNNFRIQIEFSNEEADFGKMISEFENDVKQEANGQPCQDILFITNIIQQQYQTSLKQDDNQIQSEFIKDVKSLILFIMKLIQNGNSQEIKYDQLLIDKLISSINYQIQQYQDKQQGCIIKYLLQVWIQKIEQFKERISDIPITEEILLYVDIFNQMISQNNDKIIMNLIRIDSLLSKAMNDFSFFQQQKSFIKQFINGLQSHSAQLSLFLKNITLTQQEESISTKDFISFAFSNQTFGQLSISIQLKLKCMLDQCNIPNINNEKLFISLINQYLYQNYKQNENQIPDLQQKLIFEQNTYFMNCYQQSIKDKQIQNKIIEHDIERKKYLTQQIENLDNLEVKISNQNDISKLVLLNSISKWQSDLKQKQKLCVINQDKKQLKINKLYVNQSIRFVEGYNILKQFHPENIIENRNGVEDILHHFIQQQEVQILAISADNGMGKTTLLQKLEYILINNLNKPNSFKITGNYLPIFIKSQILQNFKYSIDQYLLKEGLNKDQINYLKQSDIQKVLILDRFEFCLSEQLNVKKILNQFEWKNTKWILSVRKELLSEYNIINLLSNNQQPNNVSLIELDQLKQESIIEYLSRYISMKSKDSSDLKKKLSTRMDELLSNRNIRQLIKIPINLYQLSTLLSNDQIKFTSIQYQSDIFELFYNYQFNKQSIKFISESISDQQVKKDKNIQIHIKNGYFEYFQYVAMQIFLKKEEQNLLETEKSKLKFQLNDSIKKVLSCSARDKLILKIERYRDNGLNITNHLIQFKHISLYHYFIARAFKYDFDLNDSIHKLSMCQLKEFNINKKLIVNHKLSNRNDSSIIQTLYHLIQREIISHDFISTYSNSNIAETNKYIQYIRMSKIKKTTDITDIDVGASNLLSTLFINNFSYPNLNLSQCSFSRAYIPQTKDLSINFDRSNLSQAYLKGSNLNFVSTNTQNSYFNSLPKVFDTNNVFNFNSISFSDNSSILYSITSTGFINAFEFVNNYYSLKQQKQISSSPLSKILIQKNILLISSLNMIFVLDQSNLEIQNTFRFSENIQDVVFLNNKGKSYIVTLSNGDTFSGNLCQPFNQIESNNQYLAISPNGKYLATSFQTTIQIFSIEPTLNLQKKIENHHYDPISTLAFSKDSKYLATGSQDFSCKIWNVEKNFELVITLEDFTSNLIQVIFSNDNKYLLILSLDKYCRVYSLDKQFELASSILVNMKFNAQIAFTQDNKYVAISCDDNTCRIFNNTKEFSLFNVIQGHNYFLNRVKFSNNNKYFITSSQDKISRVWNIESGFKLQNKVPDIQSAALYQFSEDGIYLAAAFIDQTIKIWNTEKSFACTKQFSQFQNEIIQMLFSFNNKYLSIVFKSGTVLICNVEKDFEIIQTIQEEISVQPLVVYFSHNNKQLITLAEQSKVKLYNSENGFKSIQSQLEIKSAKVLATSYDSYYLALSSDNTCQIYSLDQNITLQANLTGLQHQISFLTFSRNRDYLSAASSDKSIIIWSVSNNFLPIYQFTPHKDQIIYMQFSNNSQYLVTSSKDQTCSVWNINKGLTLAAQLHSNNEVYSNISISSDNKYLALGSNRNSYQIYSIENIQNQISNQSSNEHCGHTHTVTSICYSQDGNYLATASWDRTFKIWDTEQGYQLIKTIKEHSDPINAITFSKDGRLFASVSVDKTCKIWDINDNFELKAVILNSDAINSVVFSHCGKYLLTSSWDDTIKIYNVLEEFQLLKTLQSHTKLVTSIGFSNDGRYLVSTSDDKTVKIYDAVQDFTLMHTISGHTKAVNSAKFSQLNTDLATVSKDYSCKIWDSNKKFELKITLKGHTDQISQCLYTPDDRYLITSSWDNSCKIWGKSSNYQLLNSLPAHKYPITSIAFSLDCMYLVTCSVDNQTKLWLTRIAYQVLSFFSNLGDLTKSLACFSKDRKYVFIQLSNEQWYVYQFDKGNITEQGKGKVEMNNMQKYQIDLQLLKGFDKLSLFDCSFQI